MAGQPKEARPRHSSPLHLLYPSYPVLRRLGSALSETGRVLGALHSCNPPSSPTSESISKDDFVALYERCVHAGLKARVTLRYAAGRHEVSLTCYLPTSSSTSSSISVPAARKRRHRRHHRNMAAIAVAAAPRSASKNLPLPASRAAVLDNATLESNSTLPPPPRQLPSP